MLKKNYFLQIFFILFSIFSIIKLYDNSNNLDAWQYGEWLINYQNGFVRRGLFGELIFSVSRILGNNIQFSFILLLSILCIFYYYKNYEFIKNIEFNFVHYIILFSPLFYFFFVVISKVGIKKEIILYLFFILYLNSLSLKKFDSLNNYKYFVIFLFLIVIHEAFFFYLPYLILPLLFIFKKNDLKSLGFQVISLLILSSIIMIILYYNKGTAEHTTIICQSLGNFAPMKCDWWGPISALGRELLVNVDNKAMSPTWFYANLKTWLGFLFYIFYGFLPIFLFLKFYNFSRYNYLIKNKKILLSLLILTFLFSLPLFYLAEDLSRWFNSFSLVSIFYFFPNKK